ncbi:hypothetical protein HY085_00340 [Candidatus Gottesmanbacteria bacterium]|nr:hypothetical protein [Candidatus Gottesmanbacteria bacterium]
MILKFKITAAQLETFSAVCANFVVVWAAAMLGTRDPLALTINLTGVILSWKLSVKARELLEEI